MIRRYAHSLLALAVVLGGCAALQGSPRTTISTADDEKGGLYRVSPAVARELVTEILTTRQGVGVVDVNEETGIFRAAFDTDRGPRGVRVQVTSRDQEATEVSVRAIAPYFLRAIRDAVTERELYEAFSTAVRKQLTLSRPSARPGERRPDGTAYPGDQLDAQLVSAFAKGAGLRMRYQIGTKEAEGLVVNVFRAYGIRALSVGMTLLDGVYSDGPIIPETHDPSPTAPVAVWITLLGPSQTEVTVLVTEPPGSSASAAPFSEVEFHRALAWRVAERQGKEHEVTRVGR